MHNSNNLDWKTYESITKYIYEALGKNTGVVIKGYGGQCKVVGKSGVSHQIDVLTEHSDGIHNYETAIECKYWNEKVTKDIVMKVAEIIDDTNINKGVIVCKSGFTQDGIDYAKYKNIGLVELRQIEKGDLTETSKEILIGDINIRTSIFIKRPTILSIDIGNNQNINIQNELDYYSLTIVTEIGNQVPLINYVNDFRKYINSQNTELEVIKKHYEIRNGMFLDRQTNVSTEINGITFSGRFVEINESQNIELSLVDQVWLIMKTIFEERIFTFSDNGIISEYKK